MKNIWEKFKAPIIIISYIIIVALLVYFVFLPYLSRIKDKSDEVEAKILDSQIRQSELAKLPEMGKDYADYQANSDAFNVIIGKADEVPFIKKLESLANQTGNKITMTIFDQPVSAPSGGAKKNSSPSIKDQLAYNNYISMKINLVGDYPALVNFINKLENGYFYVNILSITLKKDVESSADSNNMNDIFSPSSDKKNTAGQQPGEIIDSALDVAIYLKK